MQITRPAITATGLSRTYGYCGGGFPAVRDVDLTVDAGCLTALVGPPGAGTSTLLQCLAGSDREITGRVVRHGSLLPSGSPGGRTRLRPSRVVVLGAVDLVGPAGAMGAVPEPAPGSAGSAAVQRGWDADVLAVLDGAGEGCGASPLRASAHRALVAALAHRPDVVVADEPTAGLDAACATAVIEALRAAADRLGVTVVVATRDPLLADRADRVLSMEDGRIVADSTDASRVPVLSAPRSAAPVRPLEAAHR